MADFDTDLAEHQARVFDALRRHSDPVLREIGGQLASGALAPHQLLHDSDYVDALQRRIRHLNEGDGRELRARLFRDNGQTNMPVGRS